MVGVTGWRAGGLVEVWEVWDFNVALHSFLRGAWREGIAWGAASRGGSGMGTGGEVSGKRGRLVQHRVWGVWDEGGKKCGHVWR